MQARTSVPFLAAAALCLSALPAFSQTSPGSKTARVSNSSAGTDAPPVCNDGGPYTNEECSGNPTPIAVDASASFDPDGTAVTFLWFEECANGFFEDPTSAQTNFVIDMTGVCQRTCLYVVRVTSGGQTTVCHGSATVTDTLAPSIQCPADVTDVWGIDTSPANTGSATATDACDPSPTVSFSDVITPQQGPGIEQIITRTWSAIDDCNHTSTCTQVITLLSPSAGGGSLELDAGSCPNVFQVTSSDPEFRPVLLGTSRAVVSRIDLASLQLSRPGHAGYVTPVLPSKVMFVDLVRSQARVLGDCNPIGQDGYKDFVMSFDRAQVISALGLDQVAPGTPVSMVLTGNFKTGGSFWSSDVITVQ